MQIISIISSKWATVLQCSSMEIIVAQYHPSINNKYKTNKHLIKINMNCEIKQLLATGIIILFERAIYRDN